MKLLLSANWRLGTNRTPKLYFDWLNQTRIFEKCDRLVVVNPFAAVPNPWQSLSTTDYKESLGEFGVFWRTVRLNNLAIVLGPDDKFLRRTEFKEVLDGLENRGVTFLATDVEDVDGIKVAGGYGEAFGLVPPEPTGWRAWLAAKLGLTRRPVSDLARVGARREAITSFGAYCRTPIIAHGLAGEPSWGRVGGLWVGGPGEPPYALIVDTGRPEDSRIVRFG